MSAAGALADADGGEDAPAASAQVDPLARTVFALLVLACFAAFFLTQRLKHTPTVVQRFELTPRFRPAAAGPLALEAISFKLSRADAVTVTILDATTGDTVATLVREYPVHRYKQLSLRWNGRTGTARRVRVTHTANGHAIDIPVLSGRRAPAGEYRVRVAMRENHTSVLSPRAFTLQGR